MTTSPDPASTPAVDRFFASLRRSPVTRSQDRVIAGVAAGIAERLGVSTAIVRVGAVVLALLGPGVVLYLAAWLLLPAHDGQIRLERAVRRGEASSIVLLVVTLLAIVPDFSGRWHMGPLPLIALAVLAVVGFKKGWFGGHGVVRRTSYPTTPSAPTSETPPAPQSPRVPQDSPPA